MATGKELGFRKEDAPSLREVLAKTTLREAHNKGHPYVEIREDGKRFIFFCTLCLSRCYSESALYDHLGGNFHTQRYGTAKVTLFGPIPWPFNDGVFFFHNSPEIEQLLALDYPKNRLSNSNGKFATNIRLKEEDRYGNSSYLKDRFANSNGNFITNAMPNVNDCNANSTSNNCNLDLVPNGFDNDRHAAIPGVLLNDEVSNLEVRCIGFGQIGLRIDETTNRVNRIWCAWLGEEDSDDRNVFLVPNSDFGLIVFSYNYDLGRKPVVSELNLLGSSSPSVGTVSNGKNRLKLLSECEDSSEALGDSSESLGEDCPNFNSSTTEKLISQKDSAEKVLVPEHYDDQLQQSRFISSKAIRKALRKQQRLAAERMCDMCQQKMLPGKDVATLLNMKTGNLACSSRNTNGAFHVFHASCLIHWILVCEFEIWNDQTTYVTAESTDHKSKKKRRAKSAKKKRNEGENATRSRIQSILCPECQGTGVAIKGDELEKPTVSLSMMCLYKVKANEAHRAWMKSPEILKKCSVGLHFPNDSEENCQEKALPLKLLHFYRAME